MFYTGKPLVREEGEIGDVGVVQFLKVVALAPENVFFKITSE